MQLLEDMETAISVPNKLSVNAPRIIQFEVPLEKIREVIGAGGKVVRGITQQTNVRMEIEDDGRITICGATMAQVEDARSLVMSIIRDLVPGDVYYGPITRMSNFGAFVECLPGKEGLLHISEVSKNKIPRLEDVFKIGDKVLVMVKEIDDMGRPNLSRRRALASEDKIREVGLAYTLPEERERENLINSIATSQGKGVHAFSMKDRLGSAKSVKEKYIERGYSSNRQTRNDFDNAHERRNRGDRRR